MGVQATEKLAAKYHAHETIIQLGMDLDVGYGGMDQTATSWSYPLIRNLNTVMAGTKPIASTVEIESEAKNIMNYAFSLANSDELFAFWTDDIAKNDDPGVSTTLTFPGKSTQKRLGLMCSMASSRKKPPRLRMETSQSGICWSGTTNNPLH